MLIFDISGPWVLFPYGLYKSDMYIENHIIANAGIMLKPTKH